MASDFVIVFLSVLRVPWKVAECPMEELGTHVMDDIRHFSPKRLSPVPFKPRPRPESRITQNDGLLDPNVVGRQGE